MGQYIKKFKNKSYISINNNLKFNSIKNGTAATWDEMSTYVSNMDYPVATYNSSSDTFNITFTPFTQGSKYFNYIKKYNHDHRYALVFQLVRYGTNSGGTTHREGPNMLYRKHNYSKRHTTWDKNTSVRYYRIHRPNGRNRRYPKTQIVISPRDALAGKVIVSGQDLNISSYVSNTYNALLPDSIPRLFGFELVLKSPGMYNGWDNSRESNIIRID